MNYKIKLSEEGESNKEIKELTDAQKSKLVKELENGINYRDVSLTRTVAVPKASVDHPSAENES